MGISHCMWHVSMVKWTVCLHCVCLHVVVQYLVEHGAILDKKGDENRFSPIHFAKLKNNQEIIDYLLAKGAKDE